MGPLQAAAPLLQASWAWCPLRQSHGSCASCNQPLCCLYYRNESTFARLADPLGFVPAEDIFHVVKAIVATQRDYGRRDDRKQARLKYLVNEWGLDKFRGVVEQYYGKKLQPFRSGAAGVSCRC